MGDEFLNKVATAAHDVAVALFALSADLREKGMDAQAKRAGEIGQKMWSLYMDCISTTQPI